MKILWVEFNMKGNMAKNETKEIQENEETDKVFFFFNGYLWDWKYHWEKPLMNANWQLYRNKALNNFFFYIQINFIIYLFVQIKLSLFCFKKFFFVNLWWDILSCCFYSLHLVYSLIKMKSKTFEWIQDLDFFISNW